MGGAGFLDAKEKLFFAPKWAKNSLTVLIRDETLCGDARNHEMQIHVATCHSDGMGYCDM